MRTPRLPAGIVLFIGNEAAPRTVSAPVNGGQASDIVAAFGQSGLLSHNQTGAQPGLIAAAPISARQNHE
jgi:hypothetical protein